MTGGGPAAQAFRYTEPPSSDREPMYLTPAGAAEGGPRYVFYDRLEIGRDDGKRPGEPGLLLVPDETVSRLHCVVTQRTDGRCFLRDVSRNGTRLDGRRLAPGVETEVEPGQAVEVVAGARFLLGRERPRESRAAEEALAGTVPRPDRCVATVLVGDIRNYTRLVREALSEDLQRAVGRVFETLAERVQQEGGSVKEYQGDAILAYWEGDFEGRQAPEACRAALALDELSRRLAASRDVWPLEFPLEMHWALSTGLVLIDSIGRRGPTGLSMMGEPVVRAFRIEKFATPETGRILVCGATRELAGEAFAFRDLGERTAKGFDRPDRIFALLGER
jgi:class 3 adenylate cyclase